MEENHLGSADAELVVLLLARLRQIKTELLAAEASRAEAQGDLAAARATVERRHAVDAVYLQALAELYNQKAQIEAELAHMGARDPGIASSDQVVALARDLNLAQKLDERQAAEAAGARCWTNCVKCVTSCTKCVVSTGGSCGSSTLVSSPCVPKPGIADGPLQFH